MDGEFFDFEARLLTTRAKRLAERRAEDERPLGELATALTFRVGTERFALDVGSVASVVPLQKLTPVPAAHANFVGVMAVKGEVLSIFDLAGLLGLDGTDASSGYILILKREDARVGVLVQQVDQIAVATPTGRAAGGRPVVRVGRHEMILITNLEKVLAPYIHGDGQ